MILFLNAYIKMATANGSDFIGGRHLEYIKSQ